MNLAFNATQGINLSSFSHLNIKLNYKGSANKIRIAIRNYGPAYSTPEDGNSSKFNAVQIHSSELKREVHLALTAFSVSEWWLTQYNIPLKDSLPDMSNAMVVTIDFAEQLAPGRHEFELEKLELEGEWVTPENWYLGVLSIWMLGIFSFALRKLILLHQQTKHDTKIISQLSNSNEKLQLETDKFRRLSTVDPLTQIYNRFGIDQIINSLTQSYALIILDIDHFKRINDQRGHDAGDRTLQAITKIIKQHMGNNFYAGRWGGEEFVIIMPSEDLESAQQLAEKLRKSICEHRFEPSQPLSVSASFGIGKQFPNEDFASFFKRTDNALYKAKHKGRNCCVVTDEHLKN